MKSTVVARISSDAHSWQNLTGGQSSPQTDGHWWPQGSGFSQRREQGTWSQGAAQGIEQELCGQNDKHPGTAQGAHGSEQVRGHREWPHCTSQGAAHGGQGASPWHWVAHACAHVEYGRPHSWVHVPWSITGSVAVRVTHDAQARLQL